MSQPYQRESVWITTSDFGDLRKFGRKILKKLV